MVADLADSRGEVNAANVVKALDADVKCNQRACEGIISILSWEPLSIQDAYDDP